MFLVIPLVEFLHVLGVDINVDHENPATFLCHVSVSSVKRSRHRFASSRWHPVLTPGAHERHETPTGEPSYLKPFLDGGRAAFCDMIPEIDIWRAAQLVLKRYGDRALEESAASRRR